MMKKLTYLLLCLVMGIGITNAQTTRVTGTVLSAEDNEPIIGASVSVKGTTVGNVTDFDGKFELNVPANAKTLVISYIGMKTIEVAVKPTLTVHMSSDTQLLDEVMVVAYGTATKRSFTGSAAQVSGEKISNKNASDLTKALQGEVAGVQVYTTTGQPGQTSAIRIRGISGINSSQAPLYVVDGVPYGAEISGINPSDIESTTVLKDATAAALYGSRAANGVVLITTKKGNKGKTRVEAEVKYGVNTRIIPLYDMLEDPERFIEITWEGIKNKYMYRNANPKDEATAIEWAGDDLFDMDYGIDPHYNMWNADGNKLIDPATGKFMSGVQRKYTPEKWSDHIFRTGQKMEADVRISGGSDKTTYFTSLGYLKDEGYYIESDFERFSARGNVNTDVTSWLKHAMNLSYSYMNTNNPGQSDSQMNNGFQFVNYMPSLYPVFYRDENGEKVVDDVVGGYLYDYGMTAGSGRSYASGINPVGALKLDVDQTTVHQFVGNTMFEARFLNDFKADVSIGLQYLGNSRDRLTNPYYGDAKGLGRIRKTQSSYLGFSSTQKLSYSKSFDRHNIDVFVAHESNLQKVSMIDGSKSLLVRPKNTEWSNAVIMGWMDSDTYGFAVESYFGQVRYDFDDKYHFNASIRRDGSSRFMDGNRWGTFGSIGGAWLITREDFMQNADWLKELKLKASWGKIGNQDLSIATATANYHPFRDLYSISNMNDKPSFSFAYKGNPDLTWEKTSMWNAGLEFNLIDIFEGEIEYFNKTTTDLLFYKQVAPSLGYASVPVNDGKLASSGWEFNLLTHVVNTNDFKFDFRLNGAFYKNEMLEMPIDDTTGQPKPVELRGSYAWAKGRGIRDFYLREYAGVDSETGLALFNQYYNVKADGTKEVIHEMETYKSKNTIGKLEKETTSDYAEATQLFVGKSSMPTVSGGFGLDMDYKGITLNATFTYSLGGYAMDVVYAGLMGDNTPGSRNWHPDIEKRWLKPGDITDVPRLMAGYDSYTNTTGSDRFLTSRSYLNLANVRLGYTFPKSIMNKIKLNGLSVYVSGDNLFVMSARAGFVSMASVDGESNRSQYVPLSTIMGGIKVEF
ncbi:TonB-linked SusC/RagA family outer membrane protein [Parabacteroides sp. PFB2-10]|uniref:SusC/RagA family TonB-linked outer membrane protein n=1 Tax=Parabacteroides sp. PFB2-10 TaxID=1742405 RepID=UPI002473E319|nr:TonB-dependent receptor [Parabacteroides sp. PFB2-10]MDH6312309.1 TonB-linked SusC/RagA family outer membrane protein [Parabacteroides sp. PFB2-10]